VNSSDFFIGGYAMVSTKGQNLDLQIVGMEKVGCKKIFKEKIREQVKERLEFNVMTSQLSVGDTIIPF